MKLGEQASNKANYNTVGRSKKHHKRQHNRALRRLPVEEKPQYNRYHGWAD